MKAMLLAAGRGVRMRPLTDHTPKPLLKVGGKALIEWHLLRLVQAGIHEFVINTAHLGHQLEAVLGNGDAFHAHIVYSHEAECLETGGGIVRALPLLMRNKIKNQAEREPFLVVSADVWSDYDFTELVRKPLSGLAHLVLVNNPAHHLAGDFWLDRNGIIQNNAGEIPPFDSVSGRADPDQPLRLLQRLTYSGIAKLSPDLFDGYTDAVFPLSQPLRKAIEQGGVSGEHYAGRWVDVGTPERLKQLDENLLRQGSYEGGAGWKT